MNHFYNNYHNNNTIRNINQRPQNSNNMDKLNCVEAEVKASEETVF